MDRYRLRLICFFCGVFITATSSAQSFMECADIADDGERLACYDNAATAIKASLEKPQVGSSEQRQEQRNACYLALVAKHDGALMLHFEML